MTTIPIAFVLDAPCASLPRRRRGGRVAMAEQMADREPQLPLHLRRNLGTGQVSGAEAVMPMVPTRLAASAERERNLGAAAAAALAWDRGPVGIPLTLAEVQEERVVPLAATLLGSGMPPERLELMLPEAALTGLGQDGLIALAALRDLGIGLVLDGFGAGLASLSVLRRLPLSAMKLSRAVVRALPGDSQDVALARAGIGMAHALGLTVIADGIESETQRAWLADAGCEEGQGPLFGMA